MRIDRMLTITIMLLNRKRITARELAQKFEVSVRTVYRDIDAINLAGIPVVSFPGNDGGFGIMENYKLDRQLLTLSDMVVILSALKGMNTTFKDKELDSAIEKISNLVPEDRADELRLHLEQVVIDILPWGHTEKQKSKLQNVQKSISGNCLINFNYRNMKGEYTKRTVEPMSLIFKGYAWYLFGYCKLKNDYRIFRLSRMKNLEVTNKKFSRRDKSYKDILKGNEKNVKTVDLVLKFSPEVRVRIEDQFDEDQYTFTDEGDIIVKISFPEDEWVYSYILGYGEHVEVLEPAHIRKKIAKKAKKIHEIYKPDIMVSQQ